MNGIDTHKDEQSRVRYLIISFICTIAIVGGFVVVCLCRFGNKPEKYTDIVLEELGSEFANKSVELRIFWIGLLIGLLVLAVSYLWIRRKTVCQSFNCIQKKKDVLSVLFLVGMLSGQFVFAGYFNFILFAGLLIIAVAMALGFEGYRELVLYFLLMYGLTGLYRIYVFLGGRYSLYSNSTLMIIGTVCLYVIIRLFNINTNKASIIVQIAIPFLFLIYLVDGYVLSGEYYIVRQRAIIYILIFALILLGLFEVAMIAGKSWRNNDGISIGIINSVAIMAFNRFSGSGFVMLRDMHHPAENTVAYNEITNLGRKAFSEYLPVSGLFSWVQGLFLNVFGDGNYTEYSNANNIFYLFICILTVLALREHLESGIVLLISCCIYISDYSRVALILPFMLFLLSKRIISRPVVWYILWVVFGWCYGLYYPAYGAGIIVSLLPVALYQVKPLIKEWKEKEFRQKIVTAVCSLAVLLVIVLSVPLLIGTAKHILNMRDGMLYYDGVTIFGQALPNDFLNYLSGEGALYTLRLILGYVVRFTGPMIVVWIAFAAVINIFTNRKSVGEKIYHLNIEESSILSCFIFPIICFYFSLYRMGAYNMFNRAVYIIDFSLIITAVVLLNYGKNRVSLVLITMAVFCCTMGNSNGLNSFAKKLYSTYTVPDDYVYVDYDVDGAPYLGRGFIHQDQLKNIQEAAQKFMTLDRERYYFALFSDGDQGMAYDEILNIKGSGMLESLVIRGYSISKDTAEKLIKDSAIVGNRISPADHYYLWKWLIAGGEYIWNSAEELFYPVNGESEDIIKESNSVAMAGMVTDYCGRYAASLGNSMDSLSDVITLRDLDYRMELTDGSFTDVSFSESVQGNDIDYIYLELAAEDKYTPLIMGSDHVASNRIEDLLSKHEYNESQTVIVQWESNDGSVNQISSKVENGKLLVPIGAGVKWLSNNHSHLRIWCEDNGQIIGMPEIKNIEFYGVRDIVL